MKYHIVWANYWLNSQMDAIGYQFGYIQSERKPWYRRFGVDWYICEESDNWKEKQTAMKKFWFYLSMCENAIGSTLLAHHTQLQFHSLIHTLAGLNEIQRLANQFQELLHINWYWRPSKCPKIVANTQSPSKMIHLLTPNPSRTRFDHPSSITGEKYPKL